MPKRVILDKGDSSTAIRRSLRRRRIAATVPRMQAKGRRGARAGHPPTSAPDVHQHRNMIERLKQPHCIATPSDQPARNERAPSGTCRSLRRRIRRTIPERSDQLTAGPARHRR